MMQRRRFMQGVGAAGVLSVAPVGRPAAQSLAQAVAQLLVVKNPGPPKTAAGAAAAAAPPVTEVCPADMLKILWRSLTDLGIPILNPK